MTDPEAVLDALAAHIHEPQTVAVQGLSSPGCVDVRGPPARFFLFEMPPKPQSDLGF